MEKLEELKQINEIAHKIGITTQAELELFYNTEKIGRESLLESLQRYYAEIIKETMQNFRIVKKNIIKK